MITLNEFININENLGWDAAVEYIQENTENSDLLLICEDYFSGYRFVKDGNIDDGKCFEIRSKAVQNIIEYLEENNGAIISSLKIQTPLGEIIAKRCGAYGDYPGISLQTGDNSPAVYLEYDEVEKCFLITTYVCGGELTDDPVNVIRFK